MAVTLGQEATRLAELTDTHEKGRKFEDLLNKSLVNVPELEVASCWKWSELPKDIRRSVFPNMTKQDIGIDLVAKRQDDSWVAIQAKCYTPDTTLRLSDIKGAPHAMVWKKNVSHCWLVTTCGWTQNLENALGQGWSFLHAPSKWKDISLGKSARKPLRLDTLQREAYKDVIKGFNEGHKRGRLIMACGTGKTLVSQRIAEKLTPQNGLVLYATPSIALTGQSRLAWIREAKRTIRTVVVCSDADAGKNTEGSTTEIEAPATTDPETIAKLTQRAQRSLADSGDGMTVIFTTYQSMPKIVDAQRCYRLPQMDFAVADEAHRTAGVLKDGQSKAFQAIHHELTAQRRLYQTATPRIYSERSVKKFIDGLKESETIQTNVIDMRNDTDFGPQMHRLTFRDALQAPLSERRLVDYEIVILTIDETMNPDHVVKVGERKINNTSMYQRIAALGMALHGVVKTIDGELPDELIHSCIGYCNRLNAAREVARIIRDPKLKDWVLQQSEQMIQGEPPVTKVTSGYIDGNTKARDRFEELNRLGASQECDTSHITMNSKVLTEGIDVPALDAICFMESRESETDIVQAVGRVMRKPAQGDKSKGYIVIPVLLSKQQLLLEDVDDTLARWNKDWRVLGQVLRALKSHDPDIETDFEQRVSVRTSVTPPDPNGGGKVKRSKFWDVLRDGVINRLIPTVQSKLNEETSLGIQTNLIKSAVISGAQVMRQETGLGARLANAVGVAHHTQDPEKRACLQASLILTNTLLMHQRLIERSSSEASVLVKLEKVYTSIKPEKALLRSWKGILQHDYQAIFEPGVLILESAQLDGNTPDGLRSALRTLAEHCCNIAKTYTKMGMDHAGELFQAAMDEADAEGAYYTLTPSAILLAELACEARAEEDDPIWADSDTWKNETILDPACGSGTLLAAMATAIRRRQRGHNPTKEIDDRTLVEEGMTGLDRNAHALQIAGAQIAIQAHEPSLKKLGLFKMLWGKIDSVPRVDRDTVRLGSLELLSMDRDGKQRTGTLRGTLETERSDEQVMLDTNEHYDVLQDRLKRTTIAICNPPYTKGAKVDKNVDTKVRRAIQERRKSLFEDLQDIREDTGTMLESDSLSPSFSVLIEELLDREQGVIAKVLPTTACLATDESERHFWSKHFEILYVITLHDKKDLNWSVDTSITESLMVGRRRRNDHPMHDTQFINLCRRPNSANEAIELHQRIKNADIGEWGNITQCSKNRMMSADWSAAVWFDPELAKASWELDDWSKDQDWVTLGDMGHIWTTKETVGKAKWEFCNREKAEVAVAVSASGKRDQGFFRLSGKPDGWSRRAIAQRHNERELRNLKKKRGHLLITNTQDSVSARLMAFASPTRIVGYTWTPIPHVSKGEAEALAVWLNSSLGRIAMRRVLSTKLTFPTWQPGALLNVIVPDLRGKNGEQRVDSLRKAFNKLRRKEISQYREGYTPIRQDIDSEVAKSLNLSSDMIQDIGKRLAHEPTMR